MMLKIKGFGLIETLITLVVIGILVALAVPSVKNLLSTYQLKSAAENFYQDLKYAQSLAINSQTKIYVTVTAGSTACYGFSDQGSSCNCISNTNCTLSGTSKTTTISSLITLTSPSSTSALWFDKLRGESNVSSPVWVFTRGNLAIKVQVNSLGLITLCSYGAIAIPGYIAC